MESQVDCTAHLRLTARHCDGGPRTDRLHGCRLRSAIPALGSTLGVQAVFAARDYEPAAVERVTQPYSNSY